MKKSILFPIICVVILTIFFNSCARSPRCSGSDENKGLIKESVIIFCEPHNDGNKIVINDDISYRAIFDSSCVLPAIDFTTSTLLGQSASGGCKVKFIREVRDKGNGKIHYSIKVKECGKCKSLAYSYNWVTVPKVNNAGDVSFEVN